ncbi:MAG: hypothetical protein CVV44_09800 [Spirochaetae bacterium HGW-Spirochaetae-1]|jgi:hypothetical protein|nr:MAG: hypothetical protein CVV44_09800 [Spirochaetae bacterium HGW-Spirochaetae-1]
MKRKSFISGIFFACIIFHLPGTNLAASDDAYDYSSWGNNYYQSESVNIKNVNGKFYAYIVLLFNENPHFVNLIQKDSIPLKIMAHEGFHINAYKSYLNSLPEGALKGLARTMLSVYLESVRLDDQELHRIEDILVDRNIILKFSRDKNREFRKITLDYCIYGKKVEITTKHPLMEHKDKIYNIQPFIYYDEFSTSNSTFYYDMIYINMEEVLNDALIARKTIKGENVKSLFFVGSRVTDDIKFCLNKSFSGSSRIRDEIWEMFVIHELTHKMINNRFNYYDQVNGEELSLMSTIYAKPYLGLSVMYSYVNYNAINPHRIAAMNFVKYVAEKSGNRDIGRNPGLIKLMGEAQLKQLARDYFQLIVDRLD